MSWTYIQHIMIITVMMMNLILPLKFQLFMNIRIAVVMIAAIGGMQTVLQTLLLYFLIEHLTKT